MRSSSSLPVGKVNQLHEAMAAYPDVKPRSMEWCLKLVDALFKSKRVKVYSLPSPLCPPLKALITGWGFSCKICYATRISEQMVSTDLALGIA